MLEVTVAALHRTALRRGYLTKEGGKGLKKNWKKRWFVLHGDYLYYFVDEMVRTRAPSLALLLALALASP